MTVPGKGGRPRKWRSDADRKRAYRARRRGDAEPEIFSQALASGDELAHARELIRQLGAELAGARLDVERLQRELGRALRELKAKDQRLAWLDSVNTELTADLDQARRHFASSTAEAKPPAALNESPPPRLIIDHLPKSTGTKLLSRAQRRRLERAQRKRR